MKRNGRVYMGTQLAGLLIGIAYSSTAEQEGKYESSQECQSTGTKVGVLSAFIYLEAERSPALAPADLNFGDPQSRDQLLIFNRL